ncbi:calcium/sodium antiporter [Ignavibacteria bacterium 4148-Me]|uniref:calcium/sodium antiporter n=1 Tax=Rosettibacter primus TaxID=3111523 RepID=UPI00336BFE55
MEIFFLLFFGLLLLFIGGELLVRGSSSLALGLGLTPLVVGLTVVAFGTSSPELVVSIQAALKGNSAISIGNVVGSNIANIALILGLSAIIKPVIVQSSAVKREIPFMIFVSLIFTIFVISGHISFISGLTFILLLILYIVISIYLSKKDNQNELAEAVKIKYSVFISVLFVIFGLLGLVFGSDLFILGSIKLARLLGASEFIIGLTVVAVGTSLPELVTSIVAAIKNESDILVGNIVGSNIFNILAIIGISAVITSINLNQINIIDTAVMLFFSIIIFPMGFLKKNISRLEGFLLFLGYISYIIYLVKFSN